MFAFRKATLALSLLVSSCVLLPQNSSAPTPDPYAGRFEHHTYKNDFFGLSYHLPGDVTGNGEVHGGVSGNKEAMRAYREQIAKYEADLRRTNHLFRATANHLEGPYRPSNMTPLSNSTFLHSVLDEAVDVFADPAKDADLAAAITTTGKDWTAVAAPTEQTIKGEKFLRGDFTKEIKNGDEKGQLYMTVFATTRNGYVLRFVGMSNDRDRQKHFLKSMESVSFQPAP